MKRTAWLATLVAVLGAGWLVWDRDDSRTEPTPGAGDAAAPEGAHVSLLGAADAPRLEGASRTASEGADRSERTARPAQPAPDGYRGLVVDEKGEPVAGAAVSVRIRGELVHEGATDADGRYAFDLPAQVRDLPDWGLVCARGRENTAGMARFWIPDPNAAGLPDDRSVPRIALLASATLVLRVEAGCAGALPATVWIDPASWNGGGLLMHARTDAGGALRVEGLPQGTWRAVASAPGCGRAAAIVRLPRSDAGPLVLTVPEARTLTIRVKEAPDGTPIAGARVEVSERVRLSQGSTYARLLSQPSALTTDAQGIALLPGLGTFESLVLQASAEGYPTAPARTGYDGHGSARVAADATDVTIELSRPLTVRWPISGEGVGTPPEGSIVRVTPWTNTGRLDVPSSGTIEGSEVVVPGWSPDGASGHAHVVGYGMARLTAPPGEARGHPTAFYAVRRIEVRAREPDGRAAQGYWLNVRDGGNNPVAPGVALDGEGCAVFADLYGGPMSLVDVFLSDSPGPGRVKDFPLGSVDLAQEDGRFEYTLPALLRVRVGVTLDGRPAAQTLDVRPTFDGQPMVCERDGDHYVVTWQPIAPTGVISVGAVTRDGYEATPQRLEYDTAHPPADVTLALHATGSAQVRVLLPEDGRHRVALQRWSAEHGRWGGSSAGAGPIAMGGGQRADADGMVGYSHRAPGRYRVVDELSGVASAPFEVLAGGASAQATLDLRRCGWVRGRVEAPAGVPLAGFTVDAETDAPPEGVLWGMPRLPGSPVNPKDGTFWVRVPGDRPVSVRLHHPTCRPHPTEGQATVTAPRDGLVLRAVQGPRARLRFAQALPVRVNPGQPHPVRVRLYPGAVAGTGTELVGVLGSDALGLEFGGYEPGTYTVWVDVPGHRPLERPGVVLGEGDVDLEEATPGAGSALRVHVQVKDGQSHPRYSLWVNRLDEPTYARSADMAGPLMVVRGIGPGRFQVTVSSYNDAARGLLEEIEFDGESDVERTLDLR